MPILIETQEFEDVFGNVLPYYQANPGDLVSARFVIRSAIRISSLNNPMTFDVPQGQITSASISWLEEGFRVGDWVRITKYNGQGNSILQWWTQVNYVDDFILDINQIQTSGLNYQNNESIVFLVVTGNGSSTARSRGNLDVLLNHVINTSNGAPESLIDGEVTRIVFEGVESMVPTDIIAGDLVGNQSGQYLVSAELERNAVNPDGYLRHEIRLDFTQSGAYDSTWFDSSACLKAYLKLEWASLSGEPFERSIAIQSFNSNTGWFNQAHNTSLANSTLIQGIDELNYCAGKTFDIIVDGPVDDIGIGAQYISTDPSYYKNRVFPQQELTMLIPTSPAVAVTIYNSEINEFGAQYFIQVSNVVSIGSVTTISCIWGPNTEFNDFFNALEEDDRLFYVWVKCGNVNLTAFKDQLTCEPVVSGPLPMVQDYGYLDHSQNVTSAVGDQTGFVADTEDDVAYIGRFTLPKGELYDSFVVKLEAYNTVTEEDFTLQQAIFSFAGVQISNDGRYLLNQQGTSTTTLMNTSEKRKFLLQLDPTLDTVSDYGVKIYAPWLLDWRYWIAKSGVNVDFYPTQNENWQQYSNSGDWVVRTELTLIKDNFGYVHSNEITILPYDAEDDLTGSIDLLVESTLQIVQVAPTNTLMRIRYTEVNEVADWDQTLTWGMITVEPRESSPRYECSSVVPYDNNSQSPIKPLSGLYINIQFPQPDTAVLECEFDTSKIDLTNGIKIGGKIKENDKAVDGWLLTVQKEAQGAYSVMKVSSDVVYSGPIMRIRRNSDNTELDIDALFDGTNWIIDTSAILDFSGNGNDDHAYVVTWYDQSGSGVHATQNVAINQPPIVLNGAIITDPANGFPALQFDGINHYFNISNVPASPNYLQAFQFTREADGGAIRSIGIGAIGTYPAPFLWQNGILFDFMGQNSGTNNVHATGQTQTGSFLNLSYRKLNDDILMRQNGVQLSTVNEALTPAQGFRTIGKKDSGVHIGKMQELVLYNNNTNYDENFVEGNINFRYQTF